MLMNALEIGAIGLQQSTERLRIISHNVANISTAGYKRQVAVTGAFSNVMDLERAAVTPHLDTRAGKLVRTGNPLDIALKEGEFLVVQRPEGGNALTRGGSLSVNEAGRLVTATGLALQGNGGALSVPPTATQVKVDASGRVLADGVSVGALRIMRLQPGQAITPIGDGLYAWPQGDGIQSLKEVSMPSLQIGHTEASNVSNVQEMMALMATTRHAETMVKLIQASDDLREKAIRKLGELS